MILEEFKLSYSDDIVCSITDGASVMMKMGRISPFDKLLNVSNLINCSLTRKPLNLEAEII